LIIPGRARVGGKGRVFFGREFPDDQWKESGVVSLRRFLLGWLIVLGPGACSSARPDPSSWERVFENVRRSPGSPASYVLTQEGKELLFGAATEGLGGVERVLLTHHHRDSCRAAAECVARGIPVLAPRLSAPWLTPKGVGEYWEKCLPRPTPGREPTLHDRSFDTWEYFVPAEGVEGVQCTLEPGQFLEWRGWTIEVVGTPGHSKDHVSYVARRGAVVLCFAGDAIYAPGTLATPFTSDWDHWTSRGLRATAESLRKLAGADPAWVFPEHGLPFAEKGGQALAQTAKAVEEAGFLKSYESFSKERMGGPPAVRFLDPTQVSTAGERPWSRLSEHLFLSGNTYVVASREGALWVVDPYGESLAAKIRELQEQWNLGAVERVTVSHAHNDHYLGLYRLSHRDRIQVWTLDEVARPTSDPTLYCAPALDPRPLRVDRVLRDGETAEWREYRLKIHHLPGQTRFTMGIEVDIDGKKCFLTGDNFYHADQFSGSGGWSGFNRGLPDGYARSAAKVLAARPDWILAEHGGAMEFHEEDWRRRVRWAEVAAQAADGLSPSGDHRRDWDPHLLRVEPFVLRARTDGEIRAELVLAAPPAGSLVVHLDGRGVVADQTIRVQSIRTRFVTRLLRNPGGRAAFPLRVEPEDGSDVFFVLERPAPGNESK
jgi:glyoxylase-like metal-dependent hydrolase (beta-lactamase superfamily II)